jgi:hypothetical protein
MVVLNACGSALSRLLRIVEMVKVRSQYLHQLTELVEIPNKELENPENQKNEKENKKIGIRITLSQDPFLIEPQSLIGYQKPKLRTFLPYLPFKTIREDDSS